MNIILLGPPGAGKGTQGDYLKDTFKLTKLATGDMLRAAVASGSELGKKAKEVMAAGALVSDDIMIGIIRDAVANCAGGFLLDGFPRTLPQALALDAMLRDMGKHIDSVIQLDVVDAALVARIAGRYSCKKCGTGYHDVFRKPVENGVCDVCGSTEFVRREDDRAETVAKRLEAYHAMTAPLLPYYQSQGILQKVDGMADISEVTTELNRLLGTIKSA